MPVRILELDDNESIEIERHAHVARAAGIYVSAILEARPRVRAPCLPQNRRGKRGGQC